MYLIKVIQFGLNQFDYKLVFLIKIILFTLVILYSIMYYCKAKHIGKYPSVFFVLFANLGIYFHKKKKEMIMLDIIPRSNFVNFKFSIYHNYYLDFLYFGVLVF